MPRCFSVYRIIEYMLLLLRYEVAVIVADSPEVGFGPDEHSLNIPVVGTAECPACAALPDKTEGMSSLLRILDIFADKSERDV